MSSVTQNGDGKYSYDLNDLDGECRDILRAIHENGGEATTPILRDNAAVKRQQLHYRYRKLEDLGLIETFKDVPDGAAQEVKHARLTPQGKKDIEAGLLEDITDANASLRQLRREMDDLRDQLEEKISGQLATSRHTMLLNDLKRIRAKVEELEEQKHREAILERLDAVEQRTEGLAGDVDGLLAALGDVEGRLDELAAKADVDERIDKTRRDLTETTARAERSILKEILALQDRMAEVEESLENKASRYTADRLRENLEEVVDVREELDELEERVYKIESPY